MLGGILTANDIARLDLSNTDMVVLSACKSGQGKPTSEGLYGLQRAFKKAGVGTLVMSLWNVDDKVTSEFMTAFYEQLVQKANAWNKRKAFEKPRTLYARTILNHSIGLPLSCLTDCSFNPLAFNERKAPYALYVHKGLSDYENLAMSLLEQEIPEVVEYGQCHEQKQ